jgi:hypothetical protein
MLMQEQLQLLKQLDDVKGQKATYRCVRGVTGAVLVQHRKQSGACKLFAGMLLLGMTRARLPVHHVKPTPSTTMLQRYQVICSYHNINNSFFACM